MQKLKKHKGKFIIDKDDQFSTCAVLSIDKTGYPVATVMVDSVAELKVEELGNGMEAVAITSCNPLAYTPTNDAPLLVAISGIEISIDRVKDVIEML